MARHSHDPRTRWWGRLYENGQYVWGPALEYEWRCHFRGVTLLGDLKARVHA